MKNNKSENYLDRIPCRNPAIGWKCDGEGKVTLEIENKGIFNRIAQKFFRKPRISYVHLDENGSFVWPLIDGEKDIAALGIEVKNHFGDAAEPLYERLAKFFQILSSYGFVTFK
ncbi:MAG: PqqD family protein [Ruminococcaceae bacterium]|nr:PqqD family protein [Oscillospiraceae bacterium]